MKKMKKLLVVLMAVFLLAAPALALEQTPSLAGEWTMTKAMASGVVLTPDMLGWGMSVVLNTDGTGKMSSTVSGALQEENITWTQAGNMVTITEQTSGEVSQLSLQEDGTLRLAKDQSLMYLTRTADAPQTSGVPGGSQLPSPGGTTPGGQLPSPDGTLPGGVLPSSGGTLPGGLLPSPEGTTPGGQSPAPDVTSSADGQTVTGNNYTLQVPQGWMEINDATIQQLVDAYGQTAVVASGIQQQLEYVKSMGFLLCYSEDLNSSVYVMEESAQGLTMDSFWTMGSTYVTNYTNAGVTNYKFGGPEEIFGKEYYTGTFDAANPMMQYYQIVGDVLYTITMTNVSDADAEAMLGSFTVNG